MPKQYNIKWRKSDRQTVSNTVRQFNAKITRLLKKNPELKDFLPERITVKGLTERIKTRADFNREINSVKRFLRRGAENPITTKKGIQTTTWEKREIGYKVAQINRNRRRQREKANVSTYKGTMGSIRENNLQPKRYNIDTISPRDWDKFIQSVEKQVQSTYNEEKMKRYKENYIKGLYNVFGGKGQIIADVVRGIPDEDFQQLFFDDPVLQLDFIYDPIEAHLRIDSILEHLEAHGYEY